MANGIVQEEIMNTGRDIGLRHALDVHGTQVAGFKEKVAGIGKKVIGDNNYLRENKRQVIHSIE
jgi:hypothetical protein